MYLPEEANCVPSEEADTGARVANCDCADAVPARASAWRSIDGRVVWPLWWPPRLGADAADRTEGADAADCADIADAADGADNGADADDVAVKSMPGEETPLITSSSACRPAATSASSTASWWY